MQLTIEYLAVFEYHYQHYLRLTAGTGYGIGDQNMAHNPGRGLTGRVTQSESGQGWQYGLHNQVRVSRTGYTMQGRVGRTG